MSLECAPTIYCRRPESQTLGRNNGKAEWQAAASSTHNSLMFLHDASSEGWGYEGGEEGNWTRGFIVRPGWTSLDTRLRMSFKILHAARSNPTMFVTARKMNMNGRGPTGRLA